MIPKTIHQHGKILIVDDEIANVRFLEILLQQAGFVHIHSTTDARQAVPMFSQLLPDLLLLDISMPVLDGFGVMRQLQVENLSTGIPILVLTADATSSAKHKALELGAQDFLTKPLDETEVLLRINNLLTTHFHSVLLDQKVRERTHDLEKAQQETLQRLALAAEYRDDDTGLHTKRVGTIAGLIAREMALPAFQVELIRRAAPLHDIGKIGISDTILLKPGKLTPEEFDTIKNHTHIGAGILSGSSSPLLQLAEEIALHHHERWDGKGYTGLQGEMIPLSGRIVTVADVFDALTHERPYKKAWLVADALAEIAAQSGRQFDERVVQAFLTLRHESLL